MKRNALRVLQHWLKEIERKPLIIRGARQVGKTRLVRIFAEEAGLDIVEINLERHLYLQKIFAGYDIGKILVELEGLAGKKIAPGRSLLFLDEVQAVPEAIAALRYFYEELPDLPVIAAGSLLEFTLSDHSFSMPVGRIEYLHLGPMTFHEFLEAVDPYSAEELKKLFLSGDSSFPISRSLHHRFLDLMRKYMIVGGMPQAVFVYKDSNDFFQVARVQDSILDTYVDDFAKYSGNIDLLRLQNVFRALPSQLGKKVIYKRFSHDESSVKIRHALELLIKARLAAKVIHSHGNGIPLGAEMDDQVFKLLYLDVGLLNRISGIPPREISAMEGAVLVNNGIVAEQFIGQHLLQHPDLRSPLFLHYWQRDGRRGNAEIDFLVQIDSGIYPLEVKAGKSGSLKSIHQFMGEKGRNLALRMDANPPSLQDVKVLGHDRTEISYKLLSLPLYSVEYISDAVRSVNEGVE